jgi:hypothetical protein
MTSGKKAAWTRYIKHAGIFVLSCIGLLAVLCSVVSAEDLIADPVWMVDAELQFTSRIHHYQLPCAQCHEDAPAAENGTAMMGPVYRDLNQACTQNGCHNINPSLSHPVGKRFSGVIPPNMPLDNQARITCVTCHDVINHSDELNPELGTRQYLLRHEPGLEFCASCHLTGDHSARKRSHWQFTTRAHLEKMSSGSVSKNIQINFIDGIDTESRNCLSCHDDISAGTPSSQKGSLRSSSPASKNTDHPIGMNYQTIISRQPGKYRSLSTINSRIRLFDGQVGCGSCHNLYNQATYNLAAPFERGVLCLQCHNK